MIGEAPARIGEGCAEDWADSTFGGEEYVIDVAYSLWASAECA